MKMMVAEELRGDARASMVGIWHWERIPEFETPSLGIILLRGKGTRSRTYGRSYISTR